MEQFVRILMFSPRLTIGLFVLIFGGIGGVVSKSGDDDKKSNPWGKDSASSSYSAQQRADDGWGGGTKSGNSKDNRSRSGATTREVWVDSDGVAHEKEDMKAYHPDAFE